MTEQYLDQVDSEHTEQSHNGKKPFYKSPLKMLATMWVGKKLITRTADAARGHRETTAIKELRAAQKEHKRMERAAEARAALREETYEQRRKRREKAHKEREKARKELSKRMAKARAKAGKR